jgi:hypothetical protein
MTRHHLQIKALFPLSFAPIFLKHYKSISNCPCKIAGAFYLIARGFLVFYHTGLVRGNPDARAFLACSGCTLPNVEK